MELNKAIAELWVEQTGLPAPRPFVTGSAVSYASNILNNLANQRSANVQAVANV